MDPAVFIPALGVYGILLARLVARIRDEEKGYGKEKTACSMGFVALAAIAALAGSRPRAFRQLLPALLLCLAGDVILALYNHDRRPGLFLGGLVSFLGGHALSGGSAGSSLWAGRFSWPPFWEEAGCWPSAGCPA